jgi:pimeloyl-ACP methyl ester carboxylesterase
MATYVLVHGGCHGGWCWDKVVPLLRKKGHLVEAPDLPGHGEDKTPIQEVTLQSCVDKVCSVIKPQREPVILVGHSMGGIIISQVAEQIPDKIKTLVYLTAVLLKDGDSYGADFEKWLPTLNLSQDQSSFMNKDEVTAGVFYNDCSAEDIAHAKTLLGPESVAVFKAPVHLSNDKFGRVPRVYIECLCDHCMSPQLQKAMYTATPCLRVLSLNTSHSPFLSAPEKLVNYLLSIAELKLSEKDRFREA